MQTPEDISESSGPRTGPPYLWLNGRLVPAGEAAVSPFDRAFLYGDGLFETMRAQRGVVLYRDEHLARLRGSCAALRLSFPEEPWSGILQELLEENRLTGCVAAVKIVVSRGTVPGLGLPEATRPTILASAVEYTSPPDEIYRTGWRLHTVRTGFAPPLAGHKTLNYLYYLAARQEALDAGCDEAVITDSGGGVAETAAGSLLAFNARRCWTPLSPQQLPGVTLERAAEILARSGIEVGRAEAAPTDLKNADTVWVLNSLMGVMPVREIDGHTLPAPANGRAARLREELFDPSRGGRLSRECRMWS